MVTTHNPQNGCSDDDDAERRGLAWPSLAWRLKGKAPRKQGALMYACLPCTPDGAAGLCERRQSHMGAQAMSVVVVRRRTKPSCSSARGWLAGWLRRRDYIGRQLKVCAKMQLRMAPKAVRRQAESAVPTPSGAGFKPTPPHTQKRRLTHWVSSAERAGGQASQQAGEEGGWGNSGGGGGWSLLPTDRLPPLAPV
ncbi:hypothetical protein EGR_03261 [Echinococcus granulosus]|uniref:Uncharacterized protein n=1 Tax=Echinococcus granulosus TaxID=6210 RepID=W6ULR2_ECHGR|nr:hypothetical protein EGR_03261 [Echinococcus granulosus]EUB61988.1 hypothetical protein EGR_03261 [Echinococcus granulosus]